MEPTTVPETGKLTQSTRRSFIRGIATAGASTAAVVAVDAARNTSTRTKQVKFK
jgi:hypothetical protein